MFRGSLQVSISFKQLSKLFFLVGHRPMYCSTHDDDDCTKLESIIRTGIPLTHAYRLENLFYEQGVDVEIWAHEHTCK
jgi:hypothetical protein